MGDVRSTAAKLSCRCAVVSACFFLFRGCPASAVACECGRVVYATAPLGNGASNRQSAMNMSNADRKVRLMLGQNVWVQITTRMITASTTAATVSSAQAMAPPEGRLCGLITVGQTRCVVARSPVLLSELLARRLGESCRAAAENKGAVFAAVRRRRAGEEAIPGGFFWAYEPRFA